MKIPEVSFNDKHRIPQVGLGTWKVKDETEYRAAFEAAMEAGYRHIDTAQAYENEQYLGRAWKRSGLKRAELFITTKIAVTNFGRTKTRESFEASLERLQSDYVDLLLLHFPVPLLRKGAWQALEEIRQAGGAKSIGVSNYMIHHLEEMEQYAKVVPAVNQVELHVFLQQPELIEYCRDKGIAVEAYSPLAHGQAMDSEAVAGIARKHGKTYAQIMLRWCIDRDLIVLPKSVTPSRIRENIDIFDFKLDDEDMAALGKEDRDLRTCWSPVHVP